MGNISFSHLAWTPDLQHEAITSAISMIHQCKLFPGSTRHLLLYFL